MAALADLTYCQDTGKFHWPNGREAGSVNGDGYVDIKVKGKVYKAHRLAFLKMGLPIPEFVDHKNRVRSDNRWVNLREATKNENGYNRGKLPNNTSGYKGVCRKRGKFVAQIKADGVRKQIGTFNTAVEAHEAYQQAAAQLHGGFAMNSEGSN